MFNLDKLRFSQLFDTSVNIIKNVYRNTNNAFSISSPYGLLHRVILNLSQLIFFYIEDSITESNIITASRPESIFGLAQLAGYKPTRSISANGEVYLIPKQSYNATANFITILNYTQIRCLTNGKIYILFFKEPNIKLEISKTKSALDFQLVQGEVFSQRFTGTGIELQSFLVEQKFSTFIDEFFFNVYVNGEKWTKYEHLQDIPRDAKGFLVRNVPGGNGLSIVFGNNTWGKIPDPGNEIIVEYIRNVGAAGNVYDINSAQFEFKDSGYDEFGNEVNLNELFKLELKTQLVFGKSPDNVEIVKFNMPRVSRNFVLSNEDNYRSFFEKFNTFSKIKIFKKQDIYNLYVDNILKILLVPDIKKRFKTSDNYFTVNKSIFSLSEYEKFKILQFLDESGQKILGVYPTLLDPTFKKYGIEVNLMTYKGYDKNVIKNNIVKIVGDYLTLFNRTDYFPKSDLIALIENIPGVDSVNVEFVSEELEKELFLATEASLIAGSSVFKTLERQVYIRQLFTLDVEYANPNAWQKRLEYIINQPEMIEFISTIFDSNGDLILNEEEIPLFRGGWKDRFGKEREDIINYEKRTNFNINIQKEVPYDGTIKKNKKIFNDMVKGLSANF